MHNRIHNSEEDTYQCRHIHNDGRRCGSPCLRHEPFCYFHHTSRRPIEDAPARKARLGTFAFPGVAELSDRSGIQLALAQVLERIASNDLDPRRAGLLLYGLQIAALNLPKPSAKETAIYVEEVVEDPALGTLAPVATIEELEPRSEATRLLDELLYGTEPEPAQPHVLPTLQAVAANIYTGTKMPSPHSSLQTRLDKITSDTRGLVQPERLAVTDNAVHDLLSTGIEDRILPVGAAAPSFTLQDALTQKSVSSADLLALGPLVVKFFRGRWCPYCMTELETWQNLYPVLRERGALLVAISPQLLRQNDFTVQQHNLTFPVLSDPGSLVAASFGAAYTVPQPLRAHYRSILINIPFINGTQPSDDGNLANDPNSDATWRLPLAATFVIKPNRLSSRPTNGSGETPVFCDAPGGKIVFSQAFADHRVRPEPQDVLAAL